MPALELASRQELAQQIIRRGSKSFSLAGGLLGSSVQAPVYALYVWCRLCDDRIDDAPSKETALVALEELRARTRQAWEVLPDRGSPELGFPNRELRAVSDPIEASVWEGFAQMVRERKMPLAYALDLLLGMEMDVRGEVYSDWNHLELYCYRVAGVVGVMMSQILGLKDERALEQAVSLGIAMQLTNISRDVLEDAELGRVYLPSAWLGEEGAPLERGAQLAWVRDPANRAALARVVGRLLALADTHYERGNQGLGALPWRAALAISSASLIYRQIGVWVHRRGAHAWDTRTIVPAVFKWVALLRGVARVLASVPRRLSDPRAVVTPSGSWRWGAE